ncbi:family 43 glycosylhydrolase [Streptomyces hilarionis]|uniref:family 43 glycosylhydrolase n=1 Tax=Streptomyces hilarionis TaxID=2839954 RepID=UPI003F682A6D|nr:family 43 glycosylhydrolase [Streptomyces hilarionis]
MHGPYLLAEVTNHVRGDEHGAQAASWTRDGPACPGFTAADPCSSAGAPVDEGPEPLHGGGRTFRTFSASHRQAADHKLGLLEPTGCDPLKPASWTKKRTPVFQRSDANGVHGPGHDGFFTSPDGAENRIVRHADSSVGGGSGIGRTTRAQKSTSGPG